MFFAAQLTDLTDLYKTLGEVPAFFGWLKVRVWRKTYPTRQRTLCLM
jgi:hypothetical protein